MSMYDTAYNRAQAARQQRVFEQLHARDARVKAWLDGKPCPYCEHDRDECENGKHGCTAAMA